jgi:hypothetical protein
MGPVGSGKSVMCVMELFSRSLEQKPNANGVRQTRFVLIRNTFPQLTSTTLKTVMDWLPEPIMHYNLASPIRGIMKVPLADGTRVESEWMFVALDVDADVVRLKSLESTMVWINESGEIPKSILDMSTMRQGRYPAKIEGGPTFHGVIWDSNPPDDSHWIYQLGEKEKPSEFAMWKQPPALIKMIAKDGLVYYLANDGTHPQCNEPAENISNLPGGFDYYLKAVQSGKSDEWIKVFIMGQYGTTLNGKPVYPEFNDSVHVAKEEIKPYRGLPLLLAFDFGLNASCAFMQMSPTGVLDIVDELTSEAMGIQRFVQEMLKPKLKAEYADLKLVCTGDPAGAQRSQTTEVTCFQLLAEAGFDVEPAITNEFVARREAVTYYLTKLVNGKPAYQLSPRCDVIRKGMLGHYLYRRMRVSGSERYTDRPEKNMYSHLQDAVQYGALYYKGVANVSGVGGLSGTGSSVARRNVRVLDFGAWS